MGAGMLNFEWNCIQKEILRRADSGRQSLPGSETASWKEAYPLDAPAPVFFRELLQIPGEAMSFVFL